MISWMPYVSIACVISYVIGHALGPSMYPRADSMVSLPLFFQPRKFWSELLREAPGRARLSPEWLLCYALLAEVFGQSMTRGRTVKQPV